MADDWNVGDLAVCDDDSPCACCGISPGVVDGRAYRVIDLSGGQTIIGYVASLVLHGVASTSVAHPAHLGLNCVRFRKIRPDAQEACEEEFVTLLKRSKRKVSA